MNQSVGQVCGREEVSYPKAELGHFNWVCSAEESMKIKKRGYASGYEMPEGHVVEESMRGLKEALKLS